MLPEDPQIIDEIVGCYSGHTIPKIVSVARTYNISEADTRKIIQQGIERGAYRLDSKMGVHKK